MTFTAFFTTTSKHFRKTFFPTAIAVTLLFTATLSAQDVTPAQHLQNLAQATSLTREGVLPWHLSVAFTANKMDGSPLDTGTVDVQWTAAHRRIVTVESTVFHGKLPESGAAFAAGTLREVFLLHELIDQTIQPIARFDGAKDLSVTEETRKFGNVELLCLSVSRTVTSAKSSSRGGTQFCSAASDPTILRLHMDYGTEILRNRIAMFQKTNVALDNVISYSGKVAITGHTEKLEIDKSTSESAAPPADDEPLFQAQALIMAGHKIKGDTPFYPFLARDRHISGTVILFAVIDKTGHIQYLVPIGSPDDSLSQSALTAVKTWTYQPYLLNGQPVEVDTTVTVNYNLSR